MAGEREVLPYVVDYGDLIVYQKARALASEIFPHTKSFPREEMYSLIDQLRRSSRSIGAQIAEAWAKRRYERHFISKLTDADGELQETLHWIDIASDCGYLIPSQAKVLRAQCAEVGRLIGGMITRSSNFCGTPQHKVSEMVSEYFVSRD